jgi:hypothetical protein
MDKFADLLPEFFYDLIARITPGAVLCAALAWNVRQRVPVTELDPVIGFPVALMASYLAGFLLDTVSAMTLGGFAWLIIQIFKKLGTRFKRVKTPLKVWQIDVRKHINASLSERYRPKFIKVLAEKVMARSLVTLVAGMWISYLAPMAGFSVLAKASLLLGLVACWGKAEFNLRRIIRDDLKLRRSELLSAKRVHGRPSLRERLADVASGRSSKRSSSRRAASDPSSPFSETFQAPAEPGHSARSQTVRA